MTAHFVINFSFVKTWFVKKIFIIQSTQSHRYYIHPLIRTAYPSVQHTKQVAHRTRCELASAELLSEFIRYRIC